jgi:NAD(P)H-hydrate repair Nnr-like enzyme with NAD(P)H-hydrate epimerase domain
MRVVSVAEMRDLEAQTFAGGVPEAELQRRAGLAVAGFVAQRWPRPGVVAASSDQATMVGTHGSRPRRWRSAVGTPACI